ncbi:unnamed protein product [Periconia digitata]|uniref:Uncharacterized protein n=1 Tax=Periconia digitata TaxID=1303443 RepID=A0A9W4UIZ3_9PLEO|nr:unnamed protein product [Periconia digitata]
MPRAPRNLTRSFNNRTSGLFRKVTELHQLMEEVRISIVVEKPGSSPLVFSTEESTIDWPAGMQEFTLTHGAIIKRPSHFTTLSDSVSTGRAQIVQSLPSSPPCTPDPPRRSFQAAQAATAAVVNSTQRLRNSSLTHNKLSHEPHILSDQSSPYSNWEDWSQGAYQRTISPSPSRPPMAPRLGTLPSKRSSVRNGSTDSVLNI